MARPTPAPRRVAFLLLPEFDLLDFAGPREVFFAANLIRTRGGDPAAYRVEAVSGSRGRAVRSACGLEVRCDRRLADGAGPLDTLVVPAAGVGLDLSARPRLLADVAACARRAKRVASVCAGALVLAAAGLLDGRRATTHWGVCERLAREHPAVNVDPDPIFVRDGNVYTSAGSTAGMDLALALVEEDHGRELAAEVARTLVMFLRRPGGQSQFSPVLEAQAAGPRGLADLLAWAAGHPAADLRVERLAERAHMSVRNFTRVFRAGVGQTPAKYVERVRVDAACRLLQGTAAGLDEVAAGCGFGSADSMRRSFLRVVRVTPSDFRARFSAAAPHSEP